MNPVPDFPYFPIQFDKNGRRAATGDAAVSALKTHLVANHPSDLIVLSHGWNSNMEEAEEHYEELLTNARQLIDQGKAPGLSHRTFAVLGVLWPSRNSMTRISFRAVRRE